MNSSPAPVCPVILSGGSGTRLWPVSRRQHPKQFVPLMGSESLFTATLKRVADRTRYTAPIIVGNAEHRFFILEALEQLHIADATILLEPIGRNTAAAAMVAAVYASRKKDAALHLIMPSDHLIRDETAFHEAVTRAAAMAQQGNITLFGIKPDRPETGYGYIIPGAALADPFVKKIARFCEKPDHGGALKLMSQGALWNSGMFLYPPDVLCQEVMALAKPHADLCVSALQQARNDGSCLLLDRTAYEAMASHAFDTLVMETTDHGAVLPCAMGWNDVGSWQALWELADKDENNNVFSGSIVAKDVTSSYIRSHGPTVAILGMDNCMVIATKDVVLVAPHARSQEIKELFSMAEGSHGHTEIANNHTYVPRPWGTYENIGRGENFQVKHIIVKPGRSLSLQMHHHRAEHWVVVAGTAKVECNGVEKLIFANESIFIPQGATHRLTNPGKIDLQLIEVQSGEYLNEDDIVRYEDLYGRVPKG